MNIKELEKVVDKIQATIFKNSNSISVGMLKSHFRGSGIQFKEHQVYNPGDDVRFIDWKLSAKTSHTFVKTFEEDRNVDIVSVIDISQSMMTGYNSISKLQAAIEITCLLYLLSKITKDNVSVIILIDKPYFISGLTGHQGIATLMSVLEKVGVLSSSGKVKIDFEINEIMDENKKLSLVKSLVAKRKEVILLSDLFHFTRIKELEKVLYKKNMHCFRVLGPLDLYEKSSYAIFTKFGRRKIFGKINKQKDEHDELKGRWKSLNVKERYLENFIKEMI